MRCDGSGLFDTTRQRQDSNARNPLVSSMFARQPPDVGFCVDLFDFPSPYSSLATTMALGHPPDTTEAQDMPEIDPLDDPEERRVVFAALDSFRCVL